MDWGILGSAQIMTGKAGNLLPLSLVESPAFKNLIEELDPKYTLPSRKHLSSQLLPAKAKLVTNLMKDELKRVQAICITIDIWSSRQMRSFTGITGHYILDWCMKSVMLACKRFRGKLSGENILQEYEETMALFDIALNVVHIITDNASNMKKAFSLPGFASDVEKKSNDSEDEDQDESGDTEGPSDCADAIDETLAMVNSLPIHHGCFAHTLQLVVRDGLKDNGAVTKVLAKSSAIVSHVRKSTHATEALGDYKRLQTANATRWNSQLKMIRYVSFQH